MKIPLAFRRLLIYNNRAVTRRGENGLQTDTISYATVAQLVEQLIRNQQVGGSSPPSSSKKRRCPNGYLRFVEFLALVSKKANSILLLLERNG